MKKNIRNMLIILLTCMSCLTISYLKASAADSFQTIKSDSYLNTVGSSSVKLPDAFKKKQIDGISLVYNDKFIPIDAVVNKNIITITPSEYLKNKKTYYLRIFTSDDGQYELKLKAYDLKSIDFSKRTVVLIPPKPEKGFNFPYYLVIQKDMDKSKYKRLMVETNNTGRPSDVLAVHQESAYNTAISGSVGGYVAEVLKMPMLVPVFPRPLTDWWDNYYHTLPRVVMQKTSGDGQRIDLQLIAMIEDARELLDSNGIKLEKKIFMTGFSASGQFANRFTVLHPEYVRAVFHGGFTMYPTDEIDGNILYYPLGTADIEEISGEEFNLSEYKKVVQFVYTGDLDKNDRIVETAEDYNAYDAEIMHNIYKTEDPMKIWAKKEELMKKLGFGKNIQFHIYQGIGHGIPTAAFHDAIDFFKANYKDGKIEELKNPKKDAWYWHPEEIPELNGL